jgi:tripartite-type tricarboxylate transporter receptor subunit TctC
MDRRTFLAASTLAAVAPLRAQPAAWPSRPVRILVGFAPGGGVDAMARLVAQRMSDATRQQFVVENRAGAGGLIAAEAASRAAPDGYTLVFADSAVLIARSLGLAQALDPFTSFTPLSQAFRVPLMIIANPQFPAADPRTLVQALRAAPGRHSYASVGVGTVHHLGFESFKARTGTFVVHIPYRGASQIIPDVAGGQLPLGVVSGTAGISQARAGRVKALAMMSPDRVAGIDGVAPLSDAVPGFDVAPSLFALGPPGMSAELAARVSDALRQSLASPEAEKAAAAQGAVVVRGGPAELRAAMQREADAFARVVKEQRITAEGA